MARAFVHATEDAERVRQCVRNLAGEGVELRETRTRGYHHQPLRIIECDVGGIRAVRGLLERLGTDQVREDYGSTWRLRLDPEEGTVHFRLAKQPLLDGRVELETSDGSGDVVKLALKLRAYPANPEKFREAAKVLFD
jgi:RNA binding exosome subunit